MGKFFRQIKGQLRLLTEGMQRIVEGRAVVLIRSTPVICTLEEREEVRVRKGSLLLTNRSDESENLVIYCLSQGRRRFCKGRASGEMTKLPLVPWK